MTGEMDGAHLGPARRILVADDQVARRLVLGRGLARRGDEVFLAGSGVEALEQLDRDPGLSAVVSELAMPEVGGVHFVSEMLRRRRPGMPVLFVTGGGGGAVVPLDYPLIGVLRHPVRVTDVCDMLDQLIGRAVPRTARSATPRRPPPRPARAPLGSPGEPPGR